MLSGCFVNRFLWFACVAAACVWFPVCNVWADTFRPQPGLWYNKAVPGHGYDLEMSGNNLAVVWYAYNQDGTPV